MRTFDLVVVMFKVIRYLLVHLTENSMQLESGSSLIPTW